MRMDDVNFISETRNSMIEGPIPKGEVIYEPVRNRSNSSRSERAPEPEGSFSASPSTILNHTATRHRDDQPTRTEGYERRRRSRRRLALRKLRSSHPARLIRMAA